MRNRGVYRRLGAGLAAALLAAGMCMGSAFAAEADEGDVFYMNSDDVSDEEDDAAYIGVYDDAEAQDDDDADETLIEDEGNEVVLSDGLLLDDVLAEEERLAAEEEARRAQIAQIIEEGVLPISAASPESIGVYLENLLVEEDPTGSNGELVIGQYIEAVMSDLGYTVQEQSFHEGFLNEDYIDVPGVNIIAERGADSDQRSQDILIIAGHYDSKTDPEAGDAYANDKSGAAVMLETARLLSAFDTDLDICFLFLSGEEDGFYGSEAFVQHMEEVYRSRVRAVICVDTVGTSLEAPYYISLCAADDAQEKSAAGRVISAAERLCAVQTAEAQNVESESESEAQSGTPMDEETEVPVTEAEEDLSSSAALGEWKTVSGYASSADAFAAAGMSSVCIFQDVEGLYDEAEEEGQETEKATEPEIKTGEPLPDETETDARLLLAEETKDIFDTQELAHVTDVLAETVGWYMFEQRIAAAQ